MYMERIRTQKYLREKLQPPHQKHYSSFPDRIIVEKTSEQYFQLLPPIEDYKNLLNMIDTGGLRLDEGQVDDRNSSEGTI